MTFNQALDYISSLSLRGWRLGLDRMEELIRRADLDAALTSIRHVHVAGTNGKGSVTAYVQSILTESGQRTGGYFSPFVYDITERIQLDTKPISRDDFAATATALKGVADSMDHSEFGGVTEFEFKTAMALRYWQEKGASWSALEVGLGGRLDATNVVTPAVSVIVSIGLDHTQILGNTLGEIAREKGGIFKPGRPAVIGDLPQEAREVVRKIACEKGCQLWEFGREFGLEDGKVRTPEQGVFDVDVPLPGVHQLHNVAVAVAALEATGASPPLGQIRKGIAKTRIPGRFERRSVNGRLVILDGAHNAESIEVLVRTLQEEYPDQKFAIVFGMLEGHEPGPVVAEIEQVAERAFVAAIDFRRTLDPNDLKDHFKVPAKAFASAKDAARAALESGLPLLVTGSFYLVGEVGNTLAQ